MSGEFIDSNVLVYLFSRPEPAKQAAAMDIVQRGLDGEGVISFQVVQETLNVITRKLAPEVTIADARAFLSDVLTPLWRVMPSEDLYRRALDIQERYHYGFYDALIVAAALWAGCTTLYSEDFQHGQRIERLTVVNPFLG